jgi:hypothetical protein
MRLTCSGLGMEWMDLDMGLVVVELGMGWAGQGLAGLCMDLSGHVMGMVCGWAGYVLIIVWCRHM